MAIDIGKLVNTVSKIAKDPNMKKAVTGAKNVVSKKMQEKKTKSTAAVSAPAPAATPVPEAAPAAPPAPEVKLSPEKVILQLAEKANPLSLRQIISQTSLELDEADAAVKNLVAKGVATEQVGPDGKSIYDFS
jgi:hypothetical protein